MNEQPNKHIGTPEVCEICEGKGFYFKTILGFPYGTAYTCTCAAGKEYGQTLRSWNDLVPRGTKRANRL